MTKEEYKFYVEADRIMAGRPKYNLKRRIKSFFAPDYLEQFMLILRKVEYLHDKKGFTSILARNRFNKISLKLGFSIHPNVFGPGLYIPHYGTIVINGNAKVGANCVLHTSTCIGGSEPKTIGDNVYISTGAIILGEVAIADNITIGANSMVNQSFLESNWLVGGSPAKAIKERKAWYDCEQSSEFADRVNKINELRKIMLK